MSSGEEADRAVARKKEKIKIAQRRAKVLEMFNRGLTQMEIAESLGVDQSTISRDIRALGTWAMNEYRDNVFVDHWLEIQRMTAMHDGAMKRVWELVDDKSLTVRERMGALSLLLKCYNARKYMIPSRRENATYLRGLESLEEDD